MTNSSINLPALILHHVQNFEDVLRSTFLMAWHLAISECPIILSGEQILMKGNWESSEILAASAVFPLLGGPEEEDQSQISC